MSANEDEYGRGLELSDDFDFVIAEDGDLGISSGNNELKKDVAYRVIEGINIGDYNFISTNGREELKLDIEAIVEFDERVQSATATVENPDSVTGLDVTVAVQTSSATIEQVIPLDG
jgi:hypothetical protein